MLARVFGGLASGHYVDVGANDPERFSISYVFYLHGWSGVTIDPIPAFVEAHRALRPRDVQVQAAITDQDTDAVTVYDIPDTGLSTTVAEIARGHEQAGFEANPIEVPARRLDDVLQDAGLAGQDIQFMTVDVEGAEGNVLASLDLSRFRPWVIVVEATRPLTAEPAYEGWESLLTSRDYVFTLFDGLSRFYVAQEHYATLEPALSYPACTLDVFTTPDQRRMAGIVVDREGALAAAQQELSSTRAELVRWRSVAVDRWAQAVQATSPDLQHELAALRSTVSWRVTRPLRAVRTRLPATAVVQSGAARLRRARR